MLFWSKKITFFWEKYMLVEEKESPEHDGRPNPSRKVEAHRGNVWDKLASEWAGRLDGTKTQRRGNKMEKRDFVTSALMNVNNSVTPRPQTGDSFKEIKEKRTKEIGST